MIISLFTQLFNHYPTVYSKLILWAEQLWESLESPLLKTVVGKIRHLSENSMYNVKLKSEIAQSCPTLCDSMDCRLPGFSVHGIFRAKVLEWVAISFSRGSSWPRDRNTGKKPSYLFKAFPLGGWVEILWSNSEEEYILCVCVCLCVCVSESLSHVLLFAAPWAIAN